MALSGLCLFVLGGKKEGAREGRRTVAGDLAAGDRERPEAGRRRQGAADAEAERKTLALPAILSPVQFPGRIAQADAGELRRFAETPVVRRAINVIKDRIAAMDWQVRVRRGVRPGDVAFAERKLRALAADAGRAERGGQLSHADRAGD
jgi:hypothetical protein